MMRSRSRWNDGRIGSSASLRTRPLLSALLEACGARISRSRCSSCSRIEALMRLLLSLGDEDLGQKAGAVGQRANTEVLRQRLSEVGEGPARAEIAAGAHMLPVQQQRHVLTRV